MFGDTTRFGLVGYVFSQAREDCSNIFALQTLRGGQRIAQFFARHESRDGAAHKFVPGRVIAQPGVLRGSQQDGAGRIHFTNSDDISNIEKPQR
jgi:hypothetical protein